MDMAEIMTQRGNTPVTSLHNVTLFEGDRSYARFGWQVDFMDLNLDGIDDLMLSSPFRTSDITEELTGGENWQTDGRTDRQIDRRTDKPTHRYTNRQNERETDIQLTDGHTFYQTVNKQTRRRTRRKINNHK